jgi:hypothetical protein
MIVEQIDNLELLIKVGNSHASRVPRSSHFSTKILMRDGYDD